MSANGNGARVNVDQATTGHRITAVPAGPRRCLLAASGELDVAAAEHVAAVLAQQCTRGNCFAQLDLSAVTFLDCACLGVLVEAHHQFLAAHGTLTLTGVGPRIDRLLSLTGLDQRLFTVAAQPPSGNEPAPTAPARIHETEDRRQAQQAHTAHTKRAVLEQAAGIVMSRRHCTREQAAARLRLLAARTNRTVTDVAQTIAANAASRRPDETARVQPRPPIRASRHPSGSTP